MRACAALFENFLSDTAAKNKTDQIRIKVTERGFSTSHHHPSPPPPPMQPGNRFRLRRLRTISEGQRPYVRQKENLRKIINCGKFPTDCALHRPLLYNFSTNDCHVSGQRDSPRNDRRPTLVGNGDASAARHGWIKILRVACKLLQCHASSSIQFFDGLTLCIRAKSPHL